MIRAALARTTPHYRGLESPFDPGRAYPELSELLPDDADAAPANPAYAAVRAALFGLGLDAERFGTASWNPLRALVAPGERVVLKPNFIRHWNPEARGSVESVITHGSIIRAVADYAWLATSPGGSVVLAEAPQMDCDFDRIREIVGLDELVRFYRERCGLTLEVVDLRQEAVTFRDGIIVSRKPLPGDPAGYRTVDLGDMSFFADSGLEPDRMRGADYDAGPTGAHHRAGRNEYLLSETVLSADLVINLPKLKTHKKTGVTLALKNLVGINGDKNWLPHHCVGGENDGGDEFPESRPLDRIRSRAIDWARPLLHRGIGLGLFRSVRRLENRARGTDFIRSGNWHGNRTTWRMCLDLNRCLYYSRPTEGPAATSPPLDLGPGATRRTVLTILDGIVAGEGDGPLAPSDRPLGVIVAGTDPLAVDLTAVRLMGFDEKRIHKLCEAMDDAGPRLTDVRSADDVRVAEVSAEDFEVAERQLADLEPTNPFRPHAGWLGHIERATS
jgi:uncharacterized protein (DUF362 family)